MIKKAILHQKLGFPQLLDKKNNKENQIRK